jgi:RHS repeat-associated protein
VTKTVFDGVGRATTTYSTDGGGDAAPGATGSWTDAGNVTGDAVLQQSEVTYDADGNVLLTATRHRFDDATGTGGLGTPSSGVHARVYYAAYYYDAIDRTTATVNVGTNGGSAYTRPSSAPSPSGTVLVTSTGYNDAGWVSSTIDPLGIETRTTYDNLGRTKQTIENYGDGSPSAEDDKTTQFTYDGDNHLLTYTLLLPSSGQQTTQYNYGVSTSTIYSNDLLASVYHPDLSTGAASSSQADTYTYDALGETTGFTDRNGTVHAYSFDVLGRPTADAVTLASGSTVNNAVLRLETAYDTQGNPYLFTSYNATSSGSVVNQVLRQFNGLGQLTAEYQANSGAVSTSTTPKVQYAYIEMSAGANQSRPVSLTYPGGYELDYNYGTSGGLNDHLSRLDSLSDANGTVESYKYLGLSTVVERDHPMPGLNQTLIGSGTGEAGDNYLGLDRFGRVAEQKWTLGGTTVEDLQYGYDAAGNALYRKNTVSTGFSELNAYDNLNQLTSFKRGTLNSTNTAITGTVARSQGWTPDAAGNFSSVTTNGTAATWTANRQNEVTVAGSASPAYDANGNTTTDDQLHTLVYDAWNRLVQVKSGSTVIAGYAYDAMSRRVSETHSGTTTDLYLSAANQVLEQQQSGSTVDWNVWSPMYVDALVVRQSNLIPVVGEGESASSGGTEDPITIIVYTNRLWAVQDANWNVTALVNDDNGGTTATVVERYVYDPYGQVTYLTASWGSSSASAYSQVYLHQGLRLDSIVDLYDNRARAYSPTMMRFLQNDPIGFMAGDANTYRYEGDGPFSRVDSSGLRFEYHVNAGPPCVIDITIRINFYGTSPRIAELADRWSQAIVDAWSGTGKCRKDTCKIEVKVVYKINPGFFDSFWYANDITIATDPNGRSFVQGGSSGTWYDHAEDWVATHEAGHLLGFRDYYKDTPGGSTPDPGFEGTIMGQYGGSANKPAAGFGGHSFRDEFVCEVLNRNILEHGPCYE